MRRPTSATYPGRAAVLALALFTCAALALALARPSAAQVAPADAVAVSDENGYFLAPDVAVDARGNAVVAWYGEAGGQPVPDVEVYARRYGPDGAPLGPALRVNAASAGSQRRPAVAVDPAGAFVVAWDTATRTIWARRFAADGTPLTGDIRVSPDDGGVHRDPDVAAAADGTFVVAWQLTPAAGDDDVAVRRFDRDGAPLSGLRIPYDPAAESALQMNPALAALPNGTALVWEQLGAATTAVLLQRLDPAAAPAGPPLTVSASSAEELRDPAIAARPDGAAVVAWATFAPASGGIAARSYGADGAPLAPAAAIAPAQAADRSLPSVAASGDSAVVAWLDSSTVDGAPAGLAARALAPAGAPDGEPFYPRPPALGPAPPSAVAAAIGATSGGALWLAWAQAPPGAGDAVSAIYLRRSVEPRFTVALPLARR